MSVSAINGSNGNAVIAGQEVFAGIDQDCQSKITNAMVIEFDSKEELRKALQTGHASFTIFESKAL